MSQNSKQKMLLAERESAILNIIQECNTKFSLNKLESISFNNFKVFLELQETLLRIGVYLTVNWDSKSFKVIDIQTKKEY